MAAARGTRKTRSSKLRCPDCGFTAAHPMGLGRHRTAIHGVPSQRELRRRASADGRASEAEVARLQRRVVTLERRFETLLRNLSSVARSGASTKTR
jgi:hypothetical protein